MKSLRKMTSLAFIAAFAALLSACKSTNNPHTASNQPTEDAIQQHIKQLNQQLADAYVAGDTKTLDQLLAPQHVHNNIFGASMNKQKLLQNIQKGELKYISYDIPQMEVYLYGNDACLVSGIMRAQVNQNGQDVEGQFRFTRLFVNENGQWQVASFHDTVIQPQPAQMIVEKTDMHQES